MKYNVLPKKEFEERYGPSVSGIHYTTSEGEHIIDIPRGASTKTRMHEIAHAELGHVGKPRTLGEIAQREGEADNWIYKKLGREPSLNEYLKDLVPLIDEAFEDGYTVSNVMHFVITALRDAGWEPGSETRSAIWWWLRERKESS